MVKKQRSIAFRLSVFVLIGASLLFLLFGFINYQISRNTWIQNAQLTADVVTSQTIQEINSQIRIIENVADDIKNLLTTPIGNNVELITLLLNNYFENLPGLTGVSLIFIQDEQDSGVFQWSYYDGALDTLVTRIPYDKNTIIWRNDPRNSLQPEWSESQTGLFEHEQKTITYSIPVFEGDTLYGLFNTHVSLDWLDEMVSSLEVYQSGLAIIIDSDGQFLTHPTHKDAIGVRSIQNPVRENYTEDLANFFDEMKANQTGYLEIEDLEFTQDKIFLVYRPLEILDAFLLLYVPKKEVLGDLVRISSIFLVVAIASFFLLIVVVFFVTRKMLVPLNQLSRSIMKIGEGDFNVDIPDYTRMDEIGNLTLAFNQMKEDLKKHVVLLNKSTTERDQILTEINMAAKIQKSIIPSHSPKQLTEKGYSIHGILRPARTVGGDFYDFFVTDENSVYFVLGDVTGKGIPASFFMGMARTFFRTESKYAKSTSDLMSRINEDLCLNNPEAIFITIFCGILDLKKGVFEFTNAGHNFPVYFNQDGQARTLEHQHGPPVGLVKDQKYSSDQMPLKKNEILLLYTDGATEARNPAGLAFGEERLRSLSEAIFKSAQDAENFCHALVDQILEYESGTEQSDDLSILVLKRSQ